MGRLRVLIPGLLALLPGCGPSVGETDGGMDGGTTAGASTGTMSASPESGALPTADSTGGSIEGGSLGMGHGVVPLQLLRGASDLDDPFVGTARVEVTLLYRESTRSLAGPWR